MDARFEQLKNELKDVIIQQLREGEERLATRLEERLATRLEERLATRLEERLATRLEERLATRLEERLATRLEARVDTRIGASLKPYMESMHDLVKRAAEGYGATLEGIERRLGELSTRWDTQIAGSGR